MRILTYSACVTAAFVLISESVVFATVKDYTTETSATDSHSSAPLTEPPGHSAIIPTPPRPILNRSRILATPDTGSEASRKQAIYLIHDAGPLIQVPKIDFQNQHLEYLDFKYLVNPIIQYLNDIKANKTLYSFHRYIGKVAYQKNPDRTAFDRYKEHLRSCENPYEMEKRLCLGLRNTQVTVSMTAFAFNVPLYQIDAIEAYFIDLFGGLEDLGWNSQPGDLLKLNRFKTQSRKIPPYFATFSGAQDEKGAPDFSWDDATPAPARPSRGQESLPKMRLRTPGSLRPPYPKRRAMDSGGTPRLSFD